MTPEQITRAGQLVEAWEKPDRGGLDNVVVDKLDLQYVETKAPLGVTPTE